MLDSDTKRRIDTARDILVGKMPDPKSQVEQITIALIYKFMDDMDAEAEEFGGRRTFFAGDFARYGWARLMRGGLGGRGMLGPFARGLAPLPGLEPVHSTEPTPAPGPPALPLQFDPVHGRPDATVTAVDPLEPRESSKYSSACSPARSTNTPRCWPGAILPIS